MLQDQITSLSTRPGVYLFKNGAGEVLYVGKARSLRARVRSYFRSGEVSSLKTQSLVQRIESVETIVVGSEAEALILEANLIKEHQPRFNVQLRDDKRYPYIKVTLNEAFPRVFVTRRIIDDGSRYFGPYTAVGSMRQALDLIKRLYTVRSCRYDLPRDTPSRPCLDFHIGRCLAPCVGLQDQASYSGMINEIVRVLEGQSEAVRAQVEERMRVAAEAMDFEGAARLRDVLPALDALAREQRVQKLGGGNHDVVGLARDGAVAVGVVMRIRRGVLLGRDTQRFSDIEEESDDSLLASFATRYYLGGGDSGYSDIPAEVLVPGDFEDQEVLADILTEATGHHVRVFTPQRGAKKRLLPLAGDNARHALEDTRASLEVVTDRADLVLYDLQDKLDLKIVPRLMVCFDVSHTQGTETVASAAVFENGEPKKAEYRHMRIKGAWGNDDYRSMAEVVSRYFLRRTEEGKPIPDLALIDGGKGQLRAAEGALGELGMTDIALAALAKREESVFLPGRSEPIRLDRRDRALHVLQRIRDEAHRFAVSYNRKLRRRRTIRSDLADIPGIGPNRQRLLLKRFGSVRGVREASPGDIARIPGISDVLAARILTYLGH
ncbi:MAG: excinuclease ABC subunit UvrC [Gemmatimonadota bacterium]|nr:MAG: excinuclease ABC subunit UvrC [Gemmatimonadota bacterium]